MLTTGREIKTKQDREGAFERKNFNLETTLGIESKSVNMDNIRTVDAAVDNASTTKPESQTAPKTTVKFGGTNKLHVTDVYVDKISKSKIVAGVAPKEKMTARNIVMVCVYCVVVVALVAVIALNASALTSISAKNANLNSSINELNSQYSALSSELSALNDPTRLSELATSTLGLTAESSGIKVVEMSLPKVLPPTVKVAQTNWFDSFCDSVSSFFGGKNS